MTELECKIEGCDYRGKADSLRSHVSATTDEAHSYEQGAKPWENWYPEAYDTETNTPTQSEGSDPSETPQTSEIEQSDERGSKGGRSVSTQDDEYEEQWSDSPTGRENEGDSPSESSDSDGADDPSESDDDPASTEPVDRHKGGSQKGAIALLAPLGALLLLLLSGHDEESSSDHPSEGSDTPETPQNEGNGRGEEGGNEGGSKEGIDGSSSADDFGDLWS